MVTEQQGLKTCPGSVWLMHTAAQSHLQLLFSLELKTSVAMMAWLLRVSF